MKNKSMLYLSAFVAFIMLTGLACSALSSTPTPIPIPPTNPPPVNNPSNNNAPATQAPQSNNSGNTSSGGLVTFKDENNFYQIEVPADWKHEHTILNSDPKFTYYYADTFTSSDGGAVVEGIVYNDGQPFQGSDEAKFGLQLLNENYSKTGKVGDIHVTEEKQQSDGSDRLTWYSQAGGYSGVSFIEVRDSYNFLMFTVDWGDKVKDQYIDTLNNVVSSYTIP
ncbi:MAG: hypothetical protein M1282_15595 [Chloroflexi bacterium]|nr:hypothetical protein [Chloroflexota bacterium]